VVNLRPTERPPLRKFLLLGSEHSVDPLEVPSISPGGTEVVYYADGRLWIRSLDRFDPRPIPNSNEAHMPFWSSDGQWVAFYSSSKLWKVSAGGGEPTMVTAVPDKGISGGAWFPDGSIYISTGFSGLLRVSAQGGDLVEVLETGPGESDFHNVSGLPDGRGVLFIVHRQEGIDTLALWDGRERKQIVQLEGIALGSPVYSSSGHILFARSGSNPGIWAVPFSLQDLETTGDPFLAVANGGSPSVSLDGTLLFLPGRESRQRQMYWADREGNELGDVWEPRDGLLNPALSPDGRRVAVGIDEGGEQSMWVYDLVAEAGHRLTLDPGAHNPVWTPDGDRIAFNCTRGGHGAICVQAADGTGDTQTLVSQGSIGDFSVDGKTLVYGFGGEGTRFDIWHRDIDEAAEPRSFLQSPDSELQPRFSPDGRYLAYTSWADGQDVFLIQFPEGEGNRHVGAGGSPKWSPTGDELFYVHEYRDFMAVSVETEPSLTLGAPRKLFSVTSDFGYDIAPDGRRFLLVRKVGELENPNLAVVQNWFAEFSTTR